MFIKVITAEEPGIPCLMTVDTGLLAGASYLPDGRCSKTQATPAFIRGRMPGVGVAFCVESQGRAPGWQW
jgi:hypothetical protein